VTIDSKTRDEIRNAAKKRILFLSHAIRQMARPTRQIRASEVRAVVFEGEVIEDYPGDARGHSCLMLGAGHGGRAVHVVCSPKDEYLAIITAYLPDTHQWSDDFRERIIS
jgi:hypothetical protein